MLHLAAKNDWYSVVEKLLMTEDKDAKDATGMTPLHFAAKGGALEVVRLLLGHGASVDFEEDSGLTPLHCAIESSCEEIAELLLQFTELKAPRNGRWFPLHDATSKGSVQSVKWLLDKKVDLNLKGSEGELAIHVAASKGLDDIILLLLDQGSEINSTNIYGQTPLHRAVIWNKESTARLLFNRGADMTISDEEGNTAFYESVLQGSIKLAEFFLDNNADITICGADGYSVLHVGAYSCGEYDSSEMVKYLLRRGAPLEAECDSGNTPLDAAISLGFTSIARLFLVAGANTNRKNNIGATPLHVAVEQCMGKSLAMVKLLVGFKADVNATNASGETPLQNAVELGHFAISMALVESGSTLKTKNRKGNTLLHSSIYAGSLPLVEFFLPHCDVNEANINGETPLYFLLASGLSATISRSLIARILINRGADFNGTDKTTGRTLLHYAAEKDLETTKLLLECGLDPNCLDKEGCPPLHRSVVSCKTGYVAVLEYLLDLAVVDKGIRNHLGRTVLHMMTDCGPDARYDEANILVAKKIIERGVDINSQDKFGKSALHIAAAKCSDVLIKLLVEEGTNLKLRDQEGMTAFHVAAKNSRSEAVAILLLDGALDEAPSSLPPTLPLSKDRSETPKRKRI
jgi:ankyrin repeat protein